MIKNTGLRIRLQGPPLDLSLLRCDSWEVCTILKHVLPIAHMEDVSFAAESWDITLQGLLLTRNSWNSLPWSESIFPFFKASCSGLVVVRRWPWWIGAKGHHKVTSYNRTIWEVYQREVQRQSWSKRKMGRRNKDLPFIRGYRAYVQGVLYLVAAADDVSCWVPENRLV